MLLSTNYHTFITVHLKWIKWFSFLVGYELDNIDTDQASSTESGSVIEEIKPHVPSQDSVSDGAQNTLNPPSDVEHAKQKHPHHEEDISDDDLIGDPDYTPPCDESSAPENDDSLTSVATNQGQR